MLLTREQARKAQPRPYVDVYVPALEGELRLTTLQAGPGMTLNFLQARAQKGEDVQRQIAKLIIENAVIDDKWNPFFSPPEAEKFVEKSSQETLALLFNELQKLAASLEVKPSGNSEAGPSAG